jgi:hypothetical protein
MSEQLVCSAVCRQLSEEQNQTRLTVTYIYKSKSYGPHSPHAIPIALRFVHILLLVSINYNIVNKITFVTTQAEIHFIFFLPPSLTCLIFI